MEKIFTRLLRLVAIPFEVGQVSTEEERVQTITTLFVAIPFEVGQVSTYSFFENKLRCEKKVAIPFEVGQVSTQCIFVICGKKKSQSLLK